MNIYEFAMQMEKDGENFYRNLASKVSNLGLQNILNMLAEDEVKHYDIFSRLSMDQDADLSETEVLARTKNIFRQMSDSPLDPHLGETELYRQAQKLEEKSERFYREKAEQVKETGAKELLLKIAAEERKHYFLLENIINFVSRPKTWLENAEFNHLDEY